MVPLIEIAVSAPITVILAILTATSRLLCHGLHKRGVVNFNMNTLHSRVRIAVAAADSVHSKSSCNKQFWGYKATWLTPGRLTLMHVIIIASIASKELITFEPLLIYRRIFNIN